MFDKCEICGAEDWITVRVGAVRDGSFGQLSSSDAIIGKCNSCGVERLGESYCKDDSIYTGAEYRSILREKIDAEGFYEEHDFLQLQNLTTLWPQSVRNKTIADIGCAAGSFLDHVRGLASRSIAVEPCEEYHSALASRNNAVFASIEEAATELEKQVDLATSFSVIEHVSNPREFLAGIASLLKPDGRLLVSTPNRRDVLLDLLPDDYPAFFYRTVHRWYFDEASLARCAEIAGLAVENTTVVHRFGLSNAMAWLRDRKPTGSRQLPNLASPMLDGFWKAYLEQNGCGDYLYMWLKPVR